MNYLLYHNFYSITPLNVVGMFTIPLSHNKKLSYTKRKKDMVTLLGFYILEKIKYYFILSYNMRFLKYRNYVIFISLIVIVTNSSTNTFNVYGIFHTGDQQENFIPYKNSDLKINIQYPSNWQKAERLNDFVTFVAPIEGIGQYRYPAGLGISSISAGNVSLETIKNVHIKNMTDNLKDFQLIESSNTVLADQRPAKKIVFTATDSEEKRQSLQLITKNNDKVYLITYKADVDQYEKYFSTIQTMINSIIFLK
jgi:hypothetical protein